MSNYESSSLFISVISALIALWAIIISRNTASDQRQIAYRTQLLEARNLAATHHGKYSELLFSVQSEVQQQKDLLARAARDSLSRICHLFDQFSSREAGRSTRHIFREACKLIYEGFRPQLTWQTGLNLSDRYVSFRYAEDDLQTLLSQKQTLEARATKEVLNLEAEYKKDPNQQLEQLVLASAKFQLLLLELYNRVGPQDRQLLFKAAIEAIAPFISTHDESRPVLSEAQERLRHGLEQNALEEFSLRDKSPTLYAEYKRELAKLNVLEELSLSNTKVLARVEISTPIAELLYVGGLLFSIQMCWNWGSKS
jgi:hypothetical protein